MTAEIITTLILQVSGQGYFPFSPAEHCRCIPAHRSTDCKLGNLIGTDGKIYSVVTTMLNKQPIEDQVTLLCGEDL